MGPPEYSGLIRVVVPPFPSFIRHSLAQPVWLRDNNKLAMANAIGPLKVKPFLKALNILILFLFWLLFVSDVNPYFTGDDTASHYASVLIAGIELIIR